MDQLKEFFGGAKERLNNPFFFSFILSWFLWNWEVTLALLYWNDGFLNLLDFAACKTDWVHSLVFPVLSAFAYLVIKLGASALVTWFDKKSDNLNISIAKEKSVKLSKYLRDRERLDISLDNLEKIINAENVTTIQLNKQRQIADKARVDLAEARNVITDLRIQQQHSSQTNQELNKQVSVLRNELENYGHTQKALQKTFDTQTMDGEWKVTDFRDNTDIIIRSEVYLIKYPIVYLKNGQDTSSIGRIVNLHFNAHDNTILILKELTAGLTVPHYYWTTLAANTPDKMLGSEMPLTGRNTRSNIEYEKIL